jgi:NADP-dependent 3-hydroxy acid dehydrogenase YdfG
MSNVIQGKVVLIAGGAGGIGSETAKVLASDGALVVIADIDRERSNQVVEAIRSAGGDARSYMVDVTDRLDIKSVAETVLSDFGRIDVLINAAGIMLIRPMAELNVEELETTIDLNLKGSLWSIAAVLPGFLEQGGGHGGVSRSRQGPIPSHRLPTKCGSSARPAFALAAAAGEI